MSRLFLSLAVITVVAPASATADCAGTWVSTLHETTTPTGWIVLEGGGEVRQALREIGRAGPVLVSGRDRVRIRALALHDGDFNVTQVILAPMRPLTAGRSYRLETTTPNEAATSLARRKLQWGVEPANPERVAWTDTPIARGGSREFFGCGPAAHLSIEIPATGDARYALVDVRPHGDGSPVRWVYERRPDGRIAIGHGMCAGPVSLEAKTRYTVEVQSVIGASGRVVPAPKAAPLVMEAP